MKTMFSDRTFHWSQRFLYQDLSLYILVFINTYICIRHWKIFLLLFCQGYDFVRCGKGFTYTKLTTANPTTKAYTKPITVKEASVFGVILVCILLYSDWIQSNTVYLSVFSPKSDNCDQNNSKYGHFSRSVYRLTSNC